ncbi:MAG: right-handed parallel beta-helix repeat-containing protein [Alphaproteobacteria bacterium]
MSTFISKRNAARRGNISTAKLLSTSALTAVLALAMNPAYAEDVVLPDVSMPEASSIETPAAPEAPAAEAPWTGFTDEDGSITVETPTTTFTDITQNTQLYVGTSANLDIPEGYHVNINQASSNYLFVAKAAPDADPTFILGRLTADGRVIIIDRNGVFTGEDSVIDVAGIIMTTGDINIEQLRSNEFGDYQISNITEGAINLNGSISVADAGLAAFVAPSVSNAGVINAKLGSVALASGETVTLDLYGDDLIEVAVPGNVADALVSNTGTINAHGGVVQITAAQAKDVVDNIINVSGIVDVSSVTTQGGRIVLNGGDAGKVQVTGILDASGATGGDIEVTGQFVSAEDNAVLDASGTNGGGTIHLGGDWQGQGDTPTSDYAFVGQNAILNANAEEDGDGGEVVVWSDKVTGFFGLITAKGGANSGNGGRVETSSAGNLQAYGNVDASAANGNAGEWLLDPDNLTVIAPGANADVGVGGGSPNIITASGNATASTVTNTTIQNSLNAGTSVTLRTHDNNNAEQGDITVSATITKSAGTNATLRMESHDDVVINQAITSTAGQLNVLLLAGFDDTNNPDSGNNDVSINALINTNGGYLEAGADHDINGNGTIQTEGGRVYFVAGNGFTLPIANYTPDNSMTDTNILYSGSIDTDGGQVYMNAGDDIRINGAITTDGGAATFIARGTNTDLGDVEFQTNGSVNTTNSSGAEGNVFISAEEVKLNSTGNSIITAGGGGGTADDGTVTIERSTEGGLFVGSAAIDPAVAPHMELLTSEIGKITARELILGGANVNGITVGSLNTQANISGAVTFTAGGNGTLGVLDANNNNVFFTGSQFFNGLNVNANDNIIVNGTLTSNGAVLLNADTNAEGVGLLQINNGASIVTSDDDVTFNGNEVALNGNGFINAAGGNILLNNKSIFKGGANSLRTTGDGTITLTQWDASITAGAPPTVTIGSVQNAIDALDNTGTGQNTLFLKNHAGSTSGGVTAGDNNFVENVVINENKLKIDGDVGIKVTAATNANNAVFSVQAADFHLDPVIVDGANLVNYGVSASGAPAAGLDVDGNTFRNMLQAGVFIDGAFNGTAMVRNNTFEGTAKRGVQLGALSGATTRVIIEDNNMGVVGGQVINGVLGTGTINDVDAVAVQGNTIRSTANGVDLQGAITNAQDIQVNVNDIIATAGHGIRFGGNISNSLVIVNGNTQIDAEQDGVRFDGSISGGNTQVSDNANISADDSGLFFNGSINGGAALHIHDNVIKANLDGGLIGSGIFFNGLIDNATINIGNGNNIPGPTDDGSNIINVDLNFDPGTPGPDDGLDGIHFDKNIGTNTNINIDGNRIGFTGTPGIGPVVADAITDDGIEFSGNVTGNTNIVISDNRIQATDNGILFNGNVGGSGVTSVTIGGNAGGEHGNTITAGTDGVRFNGNVTGEALIEASNNIVNATRDAIRFQGPVSSAKTTGGLSEEEIHIFKNELTGGQNGINFVGTVSNLAHDTRIHDNRNIIGTAQHGINFGGNIDDADVQIYANGNAGGAIRGGQNGVHVQGAVTNNALFEVRNNGTIVGGDDAVHFEGAVSNSAVNVNNNAAIRYGANAGDRGIEFVSGINGNSIVNINSNTIDPTTANTGDDGILINVGISGNSAVTISGNLIALGAGFAGATPDEVGAAIDIESVTGTSTLLVSNNSFEGHHDGLQVDGVVNTTSTALAGGYGVLVTGNTLQGLNRHGIEFAGAITGAKVGINDNPLINVSANPAAGFGLDGIHFAGAITGGAQVDVLRNASVNAQNHGVYFGGTINGATLNIHDNNLQADLNNSGTGDGIRFDGAVSNATVNIGDGSGATLNVDASNVISGVDGIRFAANVGDNAVINIDGNRIGYDGTAAAPTTGANSRVSDDGIDFGTLSDDADINITDNWIRSNDDGIVFNNNVDDFVNVLIGGLNDGNTINAANGGNGNGIVFEGTVEDQALLEISYNTVNADQDGILFSGQTSNALNPVTVQDEIWINENTITGGNHGVRFTQNVSEDRHDIRITGNTIDGQSEDGIHFGGTIDDESQVWILNNDSIIGDRKGIYVNGGVFDTALVEIIGNTWIQGEDEDGIDFNGNISGDATVRINDNDDIRASDNGIEFAGISGNATVEILGNNHGIHALGHGIYFGGNVNGNADIDIHDNIINADDNNNGNGDGIRFDGEVSGSATVNIGDGDGNTFGANPSNIISGEDGIHFNNDIFNSAQIVIDGNRIGYDGTTLAGPYSNNRVGDDGIEFADSIYDDANITISDNHIRSDDDGVHFDGDVYGRANILIGGVNDKNTIDANGDGIEFDEAIYQNALLNISYNVIEADLDGVRFEDDTSNADTTFPFRDDEILITHNDIVGGDNGISFHGRMSGDRHDIRIEENDRIIGQSEHGIVHTGGIDASELWILDNDEIYGWDEGIEINGNFFNGAHIEIVDNSDVDSGFGAGITLTDFGGSGGADLNILRNHVHYTGDDGIYVENIDGTRIARNYIHNTGGDGINVRDSNFVSIDDNFIRSAGDDGIDLEDSIFSAITDNDIRFVNHNGIEVNDSAFILIDENEVADADEAGIFIDPSAVIFVTNNDLHDNDIGLHVQGPNNGYINVTGNTFTDNRVGARFESGIIDLTGISSDPSFGGYGNKFIGGQIGLEFDAWGGRTEQLSLVRTGGFFAGGYTYDGNPYDTFDGVNVPGSAGLNFGGTIGSQYFEGQSDFFVAVRSNTFTDNSRVPKAIWLDASDSTFFMPGEGLITGDVMTQAQLDFLELMFRHWPDVNNRGIFWFGALAADNGPENDNQFFEDFDPFNGGFAGLNVTITGLPRLSGGASGPTGAAGLNAINPAAGDESAPADLANIEPAAGAESTSQNVSCWGDAVSAAGAGGPVNYSYGGTFEESIAAAASCGSESF